MALEDVTEKIRQKLPHAESVKARVKLDLGQEGCIFIDSTQSPPAITHDNSDADVTLVCSLETLKGFLEGTKDPTVAFMTGQLKVRGAMGLALKLGSLLEG